MVTEFRKHKKTLIVLFGVIVILGFVTYSFISPYGLFSGLQNDLKEIEPSIEFSYTDLNGNKINLSEFKGKPLIINSWATWMPFSQTELPLLVKIHEQYQNEVTILAINRKEQVGTVRAFLSTFSIPESIVFLLDPSDNFYKTVDGYAMPESLFYNADGVLVGHTRGVLTEEELQGYIATMLQ